MTGGLAETMFDDKVAQYIAVTMIGGAVSEAAGGDFLDGAISAAMVHLFNDALSKEDIALRNFRIAMCHGNALCIEYEKMKFDMLAGYNNMKAIGTGIGNIYDGLSYRIPNSYKNAPPAAKGVLITAGGIVALPVIIPAAEYGVNYAYMNPQAGGYIIDFIGSYLPTGAPSVSWAGYSAATVGYFYGYESLYNDIKNTFSKSEKK